LLAGLCLCAASAAFADREGYQARPGLLRVGGFVLFYNAQGPLSSVPMTRRELPKDALPSAEVFGKSCQHGLSIPLSASLRAQSISGAVGDGGYRKAVEKIRLAHPEVIGLYDVRIDHHTISILGIYKRLCVEVTARSLISRPGRPPAETRDEKIPPALLER